MKIDHKVKAPVPEQVESSAMKEFIRAYVTAHADQKELAKLPPALRDLVVRFKDKLKSK